METVEIIKSRKSIRNYSNINIPNDDILMILECAISAPSGKNGQPWKFKVLTDEFFIKKIASFSIYNTWLKKSKCMIVVFLDKSLSYDYVKDVQSCGAVMQNVLLSSFSLGIGSCWIGEILSKSKLVKKELEIKNENLELMGIVALGYPEGTEPKSTRKELQYFLL